MPFSDDKTWHAGLLTIFDHASTKRTWFEDRYYGPYDKLLNYCFGESFSFHLAPKNPPRDNDGPETVDFVVSFIVFDKANRPVLIVEVKDDNWKDKAALRYVKF